MKQRKLALLLAAGMSLSLLAGCGSEETEEPSPSPTETAGAALDPDGAYAKHDPDDVVMTVDGSDVTWSEFFYALYSNVYPIEYYSSDGLVDWSAACIMDSSMTNGEYAWDNAVNTCVQYHTIDRHLTDMGYTRNAEDEAALAAALESDKAYFCGEDATEEDFNEILEQMYLTRTVYDYWNEVGSRYDRSYEDQFGADGEKLSDEEVRNFAEENGFVTVKHILVKTQDDSGAALEGEALAAKTRLAENLLTQLQEVSGDREALLAKFDELMNTYSEDTGLAASPDGYTFAQGVMVDAFDSAARALKDYELSGLVESSYGYHILLRLPTDRDRVDISSQYTMSQYAAMEAYGKLLNTWVEEADVKWTRSFRNLTAEQVFA